MQNLSKDNFSECLTGNSLVFFHRLKGCPNCDKMLPQFEAFEKEGVKVYEVDADTEKELTGQYAPIGQWNLPLTVYFENGKAINTKTGIINILDATKTLKNISDAELVGIKLNCDVELAQIRKALFEKEMQLSQFVGELNRRQNPELPTVEDFPLPTETATTQPVEPCESCT